MNNWSSVVPVLSVPIALIGLYAIISMVLPLSCQNVQRKWIRAVFLVLLGTSTLVFHVHIDQGVFIDQRGAAIAVATLFGGAGVGAATALAEIGYRLYLQGAAEWAGVAGIVGDWLGAMVLLYQLRNVQATPAGRIWILVFFGGAVGVSEALSLLLVPPAEFGLQFFQNYGLTLFGMQLFSTVLLGGLLHLEESRVRALLLVESRSVALRRSLHQVVGSLSMAMVHRDPGTAGHELRVSDLAVAVGKQLGWDEERLEGLHLAAMAHDVGQIQIPSEILNRPRKLNLQEFELIKMHVESGYQILKDVEFPWAIAEIVYQHHENMDGTGYPRGLAGEQILPEARILRVCDVLEAMLSHRPFRRAYTLPQALAELQAQSGSQLDKQIVDICVRLFNEQGYSFSMVKTGAQ